MPKTLNSAPKRAVVLVMFICPQSTNLATVGAAPPSSGRAPIALRVMLLLIIRVAVDPVARQAPGIERPTVVPIDVAGRAVLRAEPLVVVRLLHIAGSMSVDEQEIVRVVMAG